MVAHPVFSIASCRVHSLGNKLKTLGFIVCLNSLIERVLVSSAVYNVYEQVGIVQRSLFI